tara:strand:+ start:27766 stop:28035 length:270 start_codon:yes stop_codon:yes gene_type:complete
MKLSFIQESTSAAVDSISNSYSERWEGLEGIEESSSFIQFMGSNDLIFVVLGVSLIIWFVLIFYMIKIDRNLSKLEKKLESEKEEINEA